MSAIPSLSEAAIAEQKKALLALMLQEEGHVETVDSGPIRPRDRTKPAPLSFAQQRLWFIDQLQPNSSAYNITGAFRIGGPLDVSLLEGAINEILRRHEVLRTTFETGVEGPVQVVHEFQWRTFPLVDLEQLSEQPRDHEAMRLGREEWGSPFDLGSGPVIRTTIMRMGPKDHVIVYTMHHIVSDDWSLRILNREVSVLYKAYAQGQPSPLPNLAIQYADYAVWQRGWLQGEVLEKQVEYWKKQLADIPKLLELPIDRLRPPMQTDAGAHEGCRFRGELEEALKKLSQREGVTLFMTLMAAFKVLLSRYSGQDDIVVGTPMTDRNFKETEGLIGFFVNTLAMRTDLRGDPSFVELLKREREVCLRAYDHQDLPFEKLVEELQPERDMSRSPIFQVVFALQNAPNAAQGGLGGGGGLQFAPVGFESRTAKFDLMLSMVETGYGMGAGIEYNTDLFKRETIARMLKHLEKVLEGIVEDPEKKTSEVELLSEEEKRQLLEEWNQPSQAYPRGRCIHELFEEQVKKRPEAVAVVYEGSQLTYSELNERANQVARYLSKEGVEAEELIGVYMERSLEMVVGILGILKAGAAYLPMDPVYPRERLRFMVEDGGVLLVLTQEKMKQAMEGSEVLVIALDSEWEKIRQAGEGAEIKRVGPENLAYVIYTSGSTGQPKGTLVSHYNVVRLFQGTEGWFGFGAEEVWTVFHSHAFDFSVWELWGGLIYGGKCVVVPYFVSRDAGSFCELVEEEKVTVMNQTPSAFWQFMGAEREKESKGVGSLKWIIFGGEALGMKGLKPWFERHGEEKPQLVNMYGITETTVHVTWRPLRMADVEGGSVIGRTIPDLSLYILDGKRKPVPIGVKGEIYVGGGGVARGYLNRDEQTRERFVENPFGEGRLYRSGDTGRYLSNGEVEYLGRKDEQVKIRGFRIELGEIESELNRQQGVEQSVVIIKDGARGEKRLLGYVVMKDASASNRLRQRLKERLPDYMVPSAIVILDELPLTPNGKIDRKALPEPEERQQLQNEYEGPRTPVEGVLAGIWAKTLRVEKVGVHDNFFELGGHSLLALQIVSQIRQTFKQFFPLSTLFAAPTVAGLAAHLEGEKKDELDSLRWSPLVPIRSSGKKEPIFVVPPLGGRPGCFSDLVRHLNNDRPVYGLHMPPTVFFYDAIRLGLTLETMTSLFDLKGWFGSREEVAQKCIEAMFSVQEKGPFHLMSYSSSGKLIYEIARQLMKRGERVASLVFIDSALLKQTFPEMDDGLWLLSHLAERQGQNFRIKVEDKWYPINIDEVEKDKRLQFFIDTIKSVSQRTLDLDLDRFRAMVKVSRKMHEQWHDYEAEGSVKRITYFVAADQIKLKDMREYKKILQPFSTLPIRLRLVPGGHLTIIDEPNVQRIAAKLIFD